MYPLRSDVDLNLIIKKLGHDVEEIRVRTLKNLLSKLELKVVHETDLTQERSLLVRLLEWFNFPSCSMKVEVLQLIKTLSKHASASELLVGIGAVEFLSELRQDCDPSLHSDIDQILENLFKLPKDDKVSSAEEKSHRYDSEKCHYYYQKTKEEEGPGASPCVIQDPIFDSPLSYFSPEIKDQRPSLQEQPLGSSVSLGGMRGVIFSTFPWLVLTATDKHVLSSTNNSLCSSRQDVVKTSCDFLCDVVLHDFPAEILLQRPQIIRSLLSILDLRPPQLEDKSLILKALRCLSDLCQYLYERYHFYHDPDLYCPKQEFGVSQMSNGSSSQDLPSQSTSQSNLSSNSRPSVIGHQGPRVDGDGKDWDTPSSDSPSMRSPISDADSEDAVSLQFSQVTLSQFCLDVLLRTLSVYQDFTGLDVSSSALPLVWRVMRLIKLSMSSEIWSETGLSGRALIDKLNDSFELLADVLVQSNHHLQEINEPTEAVNRYLSYVSLVSVTVELTVGLVPHSLSSSVLPESLLAALYQVVVNPFVSECLPDVRPLLLPYLKNGNVQLLKTYEDCNVICEAVTYAAEFLRMYQEGGDITKLISLGELSLPALNFPETIPVVEKFVLTCSSLSADSNNPDETEKLISKFLLNTSTAEHTLKTCQSIVEESLNVSQAKDPHCVASRKVKFLLYPSVLKSVADHLSSHHVEMKESALSILLHLLTGRLLMTREIWNQFITACGPTLALIQAQSFKNVTLQHALRALLVVHDYDQGTKSLTHLQQLRLCLRFLFMKDIRDRTDLARVVLKYLEDERGSESKLPRRAVIIPEQISLLFMIEKTLPLQENIGRSVFQVESVVQMFRIFMSPDTDESLRKSSAEQLGVILQDHSLHQAFITEGGVEAVIENMNSHLEKKRDSQRSASFLAACGRILKLVVHNSPKLRHELSGQMSVYLTVIRCGLICLQDDQAKKDFCHLIILLIFDEVAGTTVSDEGAEDKFCLPSAVNNGYQLPFAVQTLRNLDVSTDHTQFLQDDSLALQAVKVSWALGVHQGCDRLSKVLMAGLDMEESPSLALSEIEQNLLLYSHQASAVKLTLKGIRLATSHYGVKQSLWQLTHWLSLEKFIHERDETKISRSVCEDMVKEDLFGVLQRFFEVTPTNQDDEVLLREILHFLTIFLHSCPSTTNQMFTNLKSQMMKDTAPMLELLGQSAQIKPLIEGSTAGPDKNNRKSGLLKQVLEFVSVFVQTLDRSSEAWMIQGQFIGSSLVSKLLYGLHLADEFHYYDLPSLEATLICLMHITARSGWSLDWSDGDSYTLCQQMLRSLLEVVSAFHIGRGGIAISFMGKGVTRNASICLLQLSHEMIARAPDKSWPSHWVHEIPGSMSSGLQWLVPLWSYRDPEVRASGLGIAVNLASTVQGCFLLSKCQEDLPGSLWTKILAIIIDHSECSMVRKQAVNLLINLLSHPMNPSKKDEPPSDGEWMGPNFISEETQVSGEAAVLSLLSNFSLVPHIITILTYFYPQCTIQPVSVVDNSSAGSTQSASGPSTMTTPDILDNIPSGQASQPRNGHQVISPVLSDQSSTVPLIAASFQADGPQPSSVSSEGTVIEPRTERASSAAGYPSVVTPCLVASVCSLLNQLSVLFSDSYILAKGKTEILKLITGIVDPNKAQSLSSASSSSLAAIQYLQMCTKCLELITVWIDKDQDLTKMISRTCQLLHIQYEKIKDQSVKIYLHCLIESCFNFLSACIQKGKGTEVLEVSSHHWIHITATISYLTKYTLTCSVRSSSFVFLAHVLSLNATANPLTAVLEAKQEDGTTQGSVLCNLLLSAYEETVPPCLNHIPQEKNGLVAALKNLSSKSLSAKQAALDAGVVETLIEDMKRCHAKLSAENLLPFNKRNKKKENGLLKEIKTILVILQNLMFENQDAKVAVKQGGLAQVLCKLWGYIQSSKSLQTLVLSTLTVYTSHCLSACLSLIRSSSGEISGTIFHYLMKLASHDPPEQRVFEVITNCLWCDECRNIIWKNGFLSNLGKFQSHSYKSKKSQQSVQAIRLWLKLLVVFTFSPDGQQMAMKVKDILELLVELVKSSQADISHLALLVIHNLCFLGPNKNKLLSNEYLLPVLLAKFDNGDLREQFVVTSALWSTLHGNQKVKAKLKAHSLQVRTHEALANLKKDMQKPVSDQDTESLMIQHESALTCLLQLLVD